MMDYDIRHGRTYLYFKGEPQYPFGYGLSYTTFSFANLTTSKPAIPSNGEVLVRVDVKNTGARAGDEVVQLYLRHVASKVDWPAKALKGFRRVTIPPGKTQTVEIPLRGADLAYWNVARHAWTVERGRVELMVGNSSADRDLTLRKTIEVNAMLTRAK
jgi:beta-glucosidase